MSLSTYQSLGQGASKPKFFPSLTKAIATKVMYLSALFVFCFEKKLKVSFRK